MNAESNMYNPWKSVEFSTDFHGECFSYVYVLVHVVWITIEVLLSLENGCTRTFCSSRMVGIPPVIPHCIGRFLEPYPRRASATMRDAARAS